MATTHTLLRGAEVFAPAPLGKRDVLLCGEKVIAIEEDLSRFAALKDAETIDFVGQTLVPGVIDNHVHILGGGTAGPISRGPELFVSELALVGTTTVVGILGDGLTRHPPSLLAKARALTREGITAYIWSGAYPYPPPNICGGAQWDLLYIPEVLGVGEIAISEERGTQPTVPELARLAAQTAMGARLAGKAGPVCIHVGSGREMLNPLLEIAENTEVGLDRFLPTHLNRGSELLKSAIDYALKGGWIDFTTGINALERGAPVIPAAQAAVEAREAGVPLEHITFSTDGNGVYTFFDDEGNVSHMVRWPITAQWEHTQSLVQDHGWPLEEALAPVTTNPAHVLGIPKGAVEAGRDADLLALDADLNVKTVYSKGRCLVRDGEPLVRGLFEQDVWAKS